MQSTIYYDTCDQYDGTPGWMLDTGDGHPVSLETTDPQDEAGALREAIEIVGEKEIISVGATV